MAATVLFMVADSVAWLFVARGLQGLATGAALSAASAALLDLHPRRDPARRRADQRRRERGRARPRRARLVVARPARAAPRVLPYVVLFALFAIAFAGALLDARAGRRAPPPPADPRAAERARRRPPAVPARRARRCSRRGRSAACSSRSARSSRRTCSRDQRHRRRGSASSRWPRSAAVAQIVFGRTAPWIGAGAGSIALAAGMVADRHRGGDRLERGLLAGSIIGGVGFGVAFLGGLRALSRRSRTSTARGHVGVLHRRLRVALGAGGARRPRRHARSACSRPSRSSAASSPASRSSSRSRPGARGRRAGGPRTRAWTSAC